MRFVALLSMLLLLSSFALIDADSFAETKDKDEAPPFGLKKRIAWTTSRVVGAPDPPPPYTVKRVFPKLKFNGPVYIVQEPGTDRIFVAELSGKIYAFPKDDPVPDSKELFLETGRELYSFSFHPDYERNGQIFVFSHKGAKGKAPDAGKSRVSRFTANLEAPRRSYADTEEILFEWLGGGHNGGEAIIGPDGYLYISTGDSTGGSDPKATGQGVDDYLSVIVRLDVDNPEPGKAYAIPKDNPFLDYPGAKPEIWAHGFRNPWRMSFDAKTGKLLVGDVGQDLWEMIWLVERGGNYGWSVQEGAHPFHPNKPQGPGPISPPLIEHHHTECRSISGGYVYYGKKFPELNGVYFYGDYEYGKIWGLRYDGAKLTWSEELADTALRIPTFGVSREGDIYLMDHPSGELYELVRAPASKVNAKFPRKLSETGLFDSVTDHVVAPGVIPYSVNAPQWIDNAVKQRFIATPGESKIGYSDGVWAFDDGAVNFETVALEMETGNPASQRRIETRMLVKQENHWMGYSYLWNDAQTDANLVEGNGADLAFTITDPAAPGGKRRQSWHVPSRNECMFCHSRAAAFVLGIKGQQLNGDHDYDGVVDNQLRALNHIGLFKKPLPKEPTEYAAIPNPYTGDATVDARARSYLDVNCSVCHVSDGGGNAKISLRHGTTLKATGLVDGPPLHGSFGLTDAKLMKAHDPFASVFFYRLSKVGRGRMPHIGSKLTDDQGLDLIYNWILQTDAPPADKPAEKADAKTPAKDKPKATAEEKAAAKAKAKAATEAKAAAEAKAKAAALAKAKRKPTEHPEYVSAIDALKATSANAEARAKVLGDLLSSTRGAFILARMAAKEKSLPDARAEAIALGVAHPDVNVRDLFERFIPEDQRTQRLGDKIDVAALLAMKGDAERGRQFFFSSNASQCKNCHRVKDVGGTVGPELSEVAKKNKRHELLESLIDPSKKVDPKFTTYVVATVDGDLLTGLLVEKTDKETVLNILKDGVGKIIRIPAEDIEEALPQKKSLMPDGMLRDLTPQQAADLLEFLTSLK